MPLFMRQILPKHWQKTKLTATGWILILVALGIGAAAYNTSSNILFMTLSLLLSSLVLSGILSLINFRKLEWSLHAPTHLKAGEVGMAEIELKNRKSVFPTIGAYFWVGNGEVKRLFLPHSLSAGKMTKLEWTFVPESRGRHEVRISEMESQFPFGFMRKTMGAPIAEQVLVWPRRIDYSFKPLAGGRRFLSGAARRTAGLGSDLLNVRPYQQGDAPRLVHWKATARLQTLMIRQLAMEGESGYHLVVDIDSDRWTVESFERLCSVACSLADDLFHIGRLETAMVEGDPDGLLAIRSIRDLHDFFDLLALLERRPAQAVLPKRHRPNRITFRPSEDGEAVIFIDENKAGQTNH